MLPGPVVQSIRAGADLPVVSAGRTPSLKRLVGGLLANPDSNCAWCFGTSGIRLRYGVGSVADGVRLGAKYGRLLVLGVGDGVEVELVPVRDKPSFGGAASGRSGVSSDWSTGLPRLFRQKSSVTSTHLDSFPREHVPHRTLRPGI